MLVDFGKAGWTEKARQQPDKVRMVLDKIKTDGLIPTIEAVRNKLDQPIPLGYCNVGVIIEVGGRRSEVGILSLRAFCPSSSRGPRLFEEGKIPKGGGDSFLFLPLQCFLRP